MRSVKFYIYGCTFNILIVCSRTMENDKIHRVTEIYAKMNEMECTGNKEIYGQILVCRIKVLKIKNSHIY